MYKSILLGAMISAHLLLAGCAARRDAAGSSLVEVAASGDALEIADALEGMIAVGHGTLADRQFAYDRIREREENTAEYAFARASVAGRVVQERGLLATPLLLEAERYARLSREIDPDFREGAATRMLGTLYVVAPARLLKSGDSELGLELLEDLTRRYPEVAENHLRLAEAYWILNDPEPAKPHLCRAVARRDALRPDDRQLLDRLLQGVGVVDCDHTP